MNQKHKESKDETKKTHEEHLLSCVLALSKGMGQELPLDRQVMYTEALSDLSEKQINFGFDLALKTFKPEFGKTFPYPAEIREWCERFIAADPIAETRKYLSRGDKPTDWEAIGSRSGFSSQEIADLLEGGKQKMRERIARLEADPQWRAMSARLGGFPSIAGDGAETAAAEHNGLSRIPKDPEDCAIWARQMARKQSWLGDERQPGEEG